MGTRIHRGYISDQVRVRVQVLDLKEVPMLHRVMVLILNNMVNQQYSESVIAIDMPSVWNY